MAIVTFWISAFIPLTVTAYTVTVPTGPHAGKTAIPLPGIARTWPGNWNKDWDCGYLTDQRGFDNNLAASARMQCILNVEVSTGALSSQVHRSSGTTEVNLVSGVQTGFAVANMSRCSYRAVPPVAVAARPFGGGPPLMTPMASPSLRYTLSAAAGDPLVGAAADIDFRGTVSITPGTGNALKVDFEGMIDDFPAYDCYATYNGITKTLFTDSPPHGNTVANLLGPATRPKSGSVTFP